MSSTLQIAIRLSPEWSFNKVRDRMDNRLTKQQEEKRKEQNEESDGQKTMVTIIYERWGV